MVIVHGADSRKETHAGFARACRARGWAAVTYDQRGNGESEEPLSPAAVDDVARIARMLAGLEGVDPERVCARGSSMGGFMAIHAAAISDAIPAVIAISPAGERHLLDGVRHDRFEMRIDRDSFEPWLGEHDLRDAVELAGPKPILFMHARGDELIPHTWTEELARRASEKSKAILVPGGHHRSIQYDAEFHEVALRWLEKSLAR
jgi:fermentation-respiration switch protein FrsA (DUF1100 family)